VLHVVAVAMIFVAYHVMRPDPVEESKIRLTQQDIAELVAEREAVVGRALGPDEVNRLVSTFIDEEVLIREATARGIECSGCNGRGHLMKRILFILDQDDTQEPTPDGLRELFETHRASYATPVLVSFDHVFFRTPPDRPSEWLERLEQGTDAGSLGDRFWLGTTMTDYSHEQLAVVLGSDFATRVFAARAGAWTGPVESSRGSHFFRVTGRRESALTSFEAMEPMVRADWVRVRQMERQKQLLAALRSRYDIEIESAGGLL